MRTWPWAIVMAVTALTACRDPDRTPGAPSAIAPSASGSASRPAPREASAAELALISPLAPGSDLAGYPIREVHGVAGGVMRVVCVKDRATVRLDIALLGEGGPEPPAIGGKYAVFYSIRGAEPEDGSKLAQALAKVLETHQQAPPPLGMTTFVPKERPGNTL